MSADLGQEVSLHDADASSAEDAQRRELLDWAAAVANCSTRENELIALVIEPRTRATVAQQLHLSGHRESVGAESSYYQQPTGLAASGTRSMAVSRVA